MTTALQIRNLHKIYPNGFNALKGVDLTVRQGDFFALLGPNGAGKSTTIGIICSLVLKTQGTVEIFGTDIDRDFSRAKYDIGVVPQEFNCNHFEKTFDIVCTQAGYYGLPPGLARERAEKYLRKLELWDKRNTSARLLSGGMKRRLMIARALVHEPRLLILDEPTAGVDIELRRMMWAFLQEINKAGTTIILTTHYLEEAENLCHNIAIIDEGRIIENTSLKDLLRTLHTEIFILDTREALPEQLGLDGFDYRVLDSHRVEVTVDKKQSLNELFGRLTGAGIEILSMKNKSNRLEELFVSLIDKKNSLA